MNAEDAFDACLPLRVVQALGEDIRELGRRRDADELHLAILNILVSEVLPDVDVLGLLPSADDVVIPLDAHNVVLVHRRCLDESRPLEELAEIQDLSSA